MFRRRRRPWTGVAGALLLIVAGAGIATDRPGLAAEYFALSDTWSGAPVARNVRPPRLAAADDLDPILHWNQVFSVRWTGWLRIDRAAAHRFSLVADDRAYLEIDDRVVAAGGAPVGAPPVSGLVELEPGLHPIEIGLAQRGDLAYLQVLTAVAGGPESELEPHRLFSRRPGPFRRLVRRALPAGTALERRLLGIGLILAGLLVGGRALGSGGRPASPRPRGREPERPGAAARGRRIAALVVFVVLGAATYAFLLRLTGSPLGFDDVRYMEAAVFTKGHGWMLDRFVHVYLLKAWQSLFPADYFLAARHFWTALATVSALALAVGAFSLGPRLQLATLAVTLWVALAQTVMFETAGAMWADYTLMAFITSAVALVLHRQSLARPPRWELHALAVGALTLGAMRSKATGAVLLWLVLAFLWEKGRLDPRRAARKLAFWLGGLGAAQLVVMIFDARYLGDAFFVLRSYNYRAASGVHLEYGEPEALLYGWMDQVWPRLEKGDVEIFEFFPLGLLTTAALAAAAATRQKPERLVVHLLPFAFLGGLLLLQTRGTYGALPRHLFPMVPTAALMAGALFHYSGIDRLGRREITSPRFLAPLAAVVLLLTLVLLPAANRGLTAADLEPLAAGTGAGYESPAVFYQRALVPAALALAALAAPLAIGRRRGRLLILLSVSMLLLADGAVDTLRLGSTRRATQRGEMIVYPWAVFADEIRGAREVTVSPDLLIGGQRFFGPRVSVEWIARLYLDQLDLKVKVRRSVSAETDLAFGSPADVERWRASLPGLAHTARADPLGRMVLVRPARAAAEPQ